MRVSSERFAVALEIGERELTTLGGNAAPLVYWTTDGARHSVTNVLGRNARGATTTYTVATDEPNRRAAISVVRRADGLRISYSLDDPKAVAALGFSMTAPARARFLGTGQRVDGVGLQRTVQPLKVFNCCTARLPARSSSRRPASAPGCRRPPSAASAFPGAVDDSNFACDLGTPPCSVGPPTNAVRWCFKASRVTITIAHGSPAAAAHSARSRRRAAARAVASPARADQVARPDLRPGRALRRHRAASLARHPDRLGAPRQPVGAGRGDRSAVTARSASTRRPTRSQGDDRARSTPWAFASCSGSRRRPAAKNCALARLPRRLADGRRQDRRPRPHAADGPRRLHPSAAAARRRSASTASRATAATRSTSSRTRSPAAPARRVQNLYPAPLRPRRRGRVRARRTGSSSRRSSARPSPARRRCCRASSGPTQSSRSTAFVARSVRRRRQASPACRSGAPTSAATPAGS